MSTLPTIRSISKHTAELVGIWNWSTYGHRQWQLQIKLPDQQTHNKGPLWRITARWDEDLLLGIVCADDLCRWLGLEQLMKLDPAIAIEATCIALQQDQLVKFFGCTDFAAITIDNIEYSHELSLFMDVQITALEDESQNELNKKSVSLYIPIELLAQHLRDRTIQTATTDIILTTELLSRVQADIILELGHITLSSRQLKALSPGCLMLMSGAYVDQGILRAKVGVWVIDISEKQEEHIWMIENIHQSQPDHMQHENDFLSTTQTSDKNQMNIDNVPVNIKVILAHANIKFSDLTKIQPGALIEIGTTQNATVKLMCNEVQIAQGQLVELDGRLAVEISMIFQTS